MGKRSRSFQYLLSSSNSWVQQNIIDLCLLNTYCNTHLNPEVIKVEESAHEIPAEKNRQPCGQSRAEKIIDYEILAEKDNTQADERNVPPSEDDIDNEIVSQEGSQPASVQCCDDGNDELLPIEDIVEKYDIQRIDDDMPSTIHNIDHQIAADHEMADEKDNTQHCDDRSSELPVAEDIDHAMTAEEDSQAGGSQLCDDESSIPPPTEDNNDEMSMGKNGGEAAGDQSCDDEDNVPPKKSKKKHKYNCDQCDEGFSSQMRLKAHSVTHKPKPESFKCEFCSRHLVSSAHLKDHLTLHTGEMPFHCEECLKRFKTSSELTRHMKSHSDARPFKCEHCPRTFKAVGNLKRHSWQHSTGNLYKCKQCNKSFRKRTDLKLHIKIHSGDAMFKCEQCNEGFKNKNELKAHVRRHKVVRK